MTIPATLSITAALVGLLAALLALGMSSAPGQLELRWFAVIAACASHFNLSNLFVTLAFPFETVLVSSRFCPFFGGLHSAAWFRYHAAQLRRSLSTFEHVFVAAVLVLAFLALVPNVILASTLYTREVPWLHVTYADPPPTRFGLFAFAYQLAGLVLLSTRYVRHRRRAEFLAPSIAIGAVIAGVAHDGLVSGGFIGGPYLLDLALLVLVLSVGDSLTRSFVANAHALVVSCYELAVAQEELVKRERLAAVGELAAVVAHEVRNPLAVVFNAVAALKKQGAKRDPLLAIIQEEAERLRDIVSDLLEFARPRPAVFAPAAIEELVRGAFDAACSAFGARRHRRNRTRTGDLRRAPPSTRRRESRRERAPAPGPEGPRHRDGARGRQRHRRRGPRRRRRRRGGGPRAGLHAVLFEEPQRHGTGARRRPDERGGP